MARRATFPRVSHLSHAPRWYAFITLAACTGRIESAGVGSPGGEDRGDASGDPTPTTPEEGSALGPSWSGDLPNLSEYEQPLDCAAPSAQKLSLRRLTEIEYRRTVATLFRSTALPSLELPADPPAYGYHNSTAKLFVQRAEADQYADAARSLAAWAQSQSSLLTACNATAKGGPACADDLIRTFGRRAFRRPLRADEVASYARIYAAEKDKSSHIDGMSLLVEAMLSSPHFLYRSEIGQPLDGSSLRALEPHELVSSLSYLLTQNMPDDELLAAADAGQLDADKLESQARRLLGTPQGKDGLLSFLLELTNTTGIATAGKDAEAFPFLTPALQRAMLDEVKNFLSDHMAADDGFRTMFTSPVTRMTKELAETIYGISNAELADSSVAPSALHGRAGLLTLPGVIFANSHDRDTGLIARGKFLRERFLCHPILPPPPGVDVALKPTENLPTRREQLAAHSKSSACAPCHSLIDGFGFSLENFDAAGRFRSTENGAPIDTSGELEATRDMDGPFKSFADISARMSESGQVQECFVHQLFRYAAGTIETPAETCALLDLTNAFRTSKLNVEALLVAYVRSDLFRLRRSSL